MKKITFLFVFAVFGVIFASEPVFHASFEENFAGNGRHGRIDAKVSQEQLWETIQYLFQPGITGKAAVVGTSGARKEKLYHAVYKKADLLRTDHGTVSFFVKPVTWNGDDKDFHVLFQAVGPDSSLIVYKYINSNSLMFLLGPSRPVNGKYLWSTAGGSVKKWKAGEWHHIAAAYDRELIELFIDGKRVSKVRRKALPQKHFSQFAAGALQPDKWKTSLGLTLVDELKIYDRKLTANEVHELAATVIKSVQKPELKEITTIVDRKKKCVDLYFTAEGFFSRGMVEMFSGSEKVFCQKLQKVHAQNKVTIPLSGLKSGNCKIIITGLNSSGKRVARQEIPFLVPTAVESWRNNRSGVTSKVPEPWKDLQFDSGKTIASGTTFSYQFSGSPLPEQVTAAGQDLLKRPTELLLNGKKLDLRGKVKILRRGGDVTVFSSETKVSGFLIKSTVETHFDGFVWVKLSLIPEKKTVVNRLQLRFPFRKESSSLFNSMNKFYVSYEAGHCGKFRQYDMNLYRRPPVMFVGNEHCGLQWFCEKLPCWYNQNKDQSLQLLSGKSENLLALNFIDKAVTLDRQLDYEFGFQSVPLRPMPENWRSWCPYRNFDPYFVWSKYHHYPYVDSLRTDDAYKKMYKAKTRRFGKQLFYYFAGFTITPTFPEWPYYASEWMLTPPEHGIYGCVGKPASYFTWICPNSEEYRDFYVDRLKTVIETLDMHNIYIDNSDAQMCDNPRHGCGYTGTDGKRYPSFNLRGTRRLAQRVYTMFKTLRPEGRVIRHMSAKPVAPVVAFADMIVDGELYNKTVAVDESYFNIFDPEMFRASFCGKLWGIPQFFIPQFTRVIPVYNPKRYPAWKTPQARLQHQDKIRHFIGYFLVHDTQIFQLFGVRVHEVEKLKARFGLRNESRFIGYFESSAPWKANPGVMVSGYIDNGKLMLIVMNESNTDRVELTLNTAMLRKLGITDFRFKNAETGAPVFSDKTVTIPLRKHDYMMLWNLSK